MKAPGRVALGLTAAAVVLAAGCWQRDATKRFVTEPVTRADVARSIVATGTVNPVVTVQVGTYVSGVIQSIACDFDTRVEAGQVCAKIDPRPYQQAVDQAKAALATARAQLRKDEASRDYARQSYERGRALFEKGASSEDSVDALRSAYEQAEAQVHLSRASIDQRRAALEAAQVDLGYTDIVSPVTGIVVSRNVDVGQTVAASFQTPTLFLIAQDLGRMQVDTNVSESDVGAARIGQLARFTVEAYPDRAFEGRVVQVRKAPISVQNVITYDVVVGVDNPELLLFPGMTANVRIVVEERRDALTVPARALRFEPAGADGEADGPRVWVLRDGRPQPVEVALGIDDGTRAEVTHGELEAGEAVIVDETRAADGPPARSPFRF
jgi:HlyD family secretion protein